MAHRNVSRECLLWGHRPRWEGSEETESRPRCDQVGRRNSPPFEWISPYRYVSVQARSVLRSSREPVPVRVSAESETLPETECGWDVRRGSPPSLSRQCQRPPASKLLLPRRPNTKITGPHPMLGLLLQRIHFRHFAISRADPKRFDLVGSEVSGPSSVRKPEVETNSF